MMNSPGRFRKKPVEIDAMLFTGEVGKAFDWMNSHGEPFPTARSALHVRDDWLSDAIYIKTLEGEMKVDVGDWIIRGVQGEFYPCKPDIFEATYEEVLEDNRKMPAETENRIMDGIATATEIRERKQSRG
jgi:hypothetical protein